MHTRTFSWRALSTGFYLFIAILCPATLPACTGSGDAPASTTNAPPSTQPEAQATPTPLPSSTPAVSVAAPVISPPPQEVEAALARVYQTAVVADAGGLASALTGDFNGDNSQDIAVIVKPNKAHLSEMNSEFSSWIVGDPRRVQMPAQVARAGEASPAPAPVRVEVGDTLLAVIHGYKSEGWRNADAKQTYLLKNVTGSEMRAQTVTEARKMLKDAAAAQHLPYVRGDLICEVLDGKAGCLYWTGAKYGWHDGTSSPPTEKAKGHAAAPPAQ